MSRHAKQPKPVVMYMHTLDRTPARVLRWTRGRVTMVKVTPGVRLKPLASLNAIRREWSEVADDAFAQSRRAFPFSPRDVHAKAASELVNRLGYVLVEVPASPAGRASALAGQ